MSAVPSVDLNLLVALDVLLAENSVTGAARRLGLSASAMSRTLTRLRAVTGDQLLVRAGRGLVPTARAAELRERVSQLAHDARVILSPRMDRLDLVSLERTFTLRAGEGFVELFAAPLVASIAELAPRVRLRFAPKPMKDARPLREGSIDLEIGVLGALGPEIRSRFLFRDGFVGVVRSGHPLLDGPITPQRYAACRHVVCSRRDAFTGPVDDALDELGLRREIVAVVPGHPDAVRVARQTDLVALVPRSSYAGAVASTAGRMADIVSFELPVETPDVQISVMWHPRVDDDGAHRWLRDTVVAVCIRASSAYFAETSTALEEATV